jgi:thiamine-phosphate pyrophosphorylase
MLRQVTGGRRHPSTKYVPTCWLMTDQRLGGLMIPIAARILPPRSAIIMRPHALSPTELAKMSGALRRVARARRHLFLWGGRHMSPGYAGRHCRRGSSHGPAAFVSRPVHSVREALIAQRRGADAVLISPVFLTRTHQQAEPIGRRRFAQLAALANTPAIALGGMDAKRFRTMQRSGAIGWAAIDAWLAGAECQRR